MRNNIKSTAVFLLLIAAPLFVFAQSGLKANKVISDWPDVSKKAANAMIEKYGEPSEVTASMLMWEETGPFIRTIVYKQETDHDFPMPHKDVLEQFIHYDVPVDKFDDLAEYDGSVIVERTKGEMSARCDKEAANLLALNLANDIITGKATVNEARQQYADVIMKMLQGEKDVYVKACSLLFQAEILQIQMLQ